MKSEEFGQLSFAQLAAASTNRQLTEDSFATICESVLGFRFSLSGRFPERNGSVEGRAELVGGSAFRAYTRVDACLADCERSSDNGGRVRQTYAGLRFICVEHRQGARGRDDEGRRRHEEVAANFDCVRLSQRARR